MDKLVPFFKPGSKGPKELAKSLRDSLHAMCREKGGKKAEKADAEAAKYLQAMKVMLCGLGYQVPRAQADLVALLANELYQMEMLLTMIVNLQRFNFEARKDVCQIFSSILKRQLGTRLPTVEHICTREVILAKLVLGCENPEIALNCGTMLRECAIHEPLVRIILHGEHFYKFFEYVEMSTFDIACDAFASFRDLLTRHKYLSAEFLDKNYDNFFEHYKRLLVSENYVIRRQSLKLLGDLLLDRTNFTTMNKYVSNRDNLKMMMNFLRDPSKIIQLDAFHIFKVFVANSSKTRPVFTILYRNKEKLVDLLTYFRSDQKDNEQFMVEKSYLIRQIAALNEDTFKEPSAAMASSIRFITPTTTPVKS